MKQFRDTRYYVSEEGKIYSYYPEKIWYSTGRNGKKYFNKKFEEKWVERKIQINRHGYGFFCGSNNGKRFTLSAHRVIAECYLGSCPEGYEVDHIDGDKMNNNISNLQYLTPKENKAKRVFNDSPR